MVEETDMAVTEPAETDDLENLPLVALTPGDMPEQQRKLADWCGRKIDSVQRELATFVALEDEAMAGGFKRASYTAAVNRTKKRIVYYEKIKAAVEAGYLIVPNMPTRAFAVRVGRAKPSRREGWHPSAVDDAKPELLPAGEGRYVDDTVYTSSRSYTEQRDGKPVERVRFFATAFDDDVDFPLQGVMPEVLRATSRAMALRLFDQLGVVLNNGGRDPIVVGQLLDPRGNSRVCTFFVAWWLNTATL
jgi:hypothetical protein